MQDGDTARFLLVLIQRRRHLGANAPPAACWVTRSFTTSRYAGRGRAEGLPEPVSGRETGKGEGPGRLPEFRSLPILGHLLSRLPSPQNGSPPSLLSPLLAPEPCGRAVFRSAHMLAFVICFANYTVAYSPNQVTLPPPPGCCRVGKDAKKTQRKDAKKQ